MYTLEKIMGLSGVEWMKDDSNPAENCPASYIYENPCTNIYPSTGFTQWCAQNRDLNACTHKKEVAAVLRLMDCDSTFAFPRTSLI